jgi:hypothetical protein
MPEEVTKRIWVRAWRKTVHHLMWNEGLAGRAARREATRRTEQQFGPCPEDERRNGLKAAVLRLIGGLVMPESVKTFVNRWGVLISVVYVAVSALLKVLAESGVEWASTVATALAAIFGMLGLNPLEPTLATAVTTGVASAWALYGASRKVASQVKKAKKG